MGYGDLLQPSTKSTSSGSDKLAMEVDLNLSGPRMAMDLELPTAIYDPELGETRIEKQSFCFPYQAMVCLIVQKCIELGSCCIASRR